MNFSSARAILSPRLALARLRSDPVLRNTAIYLTGSTVAGFLGYVFHFETGHLLGPSAYSVVASGIASLYVLTLPVIGLQLVSARYASVSAARGQARAVLPMVVRLTSFSLLGALPIVVLLIVFAPAVASFLNLPDRRVVYVMLAVALATLLVTINRGAIQGFRRFVALSGNMLVDMISRLAFAAAFVAAGLGAVGALAAVAIGPIVAYGQSFMFLRSDRDDVAGSGRMTGVGQYAILATVASVGINYLFSIDTLLAKHYLTASAAGLYAAGSVLGRVVYFLGLSVTGVMFPEVANLHARNERHFHVVDISLLLVALMGAALVVVFILLPGLVLLPYGPSFAPARQYLGVFALALTMLTIANLFINYFLSLARRVFVIPLFGACILETVLLVAFHGGIWQILLVVLISLSLLAAVMSVLYLSDRWTRRSAA